MKGIIAPLRGGSIERPSLSPVGRLLPISFGARLASRAFQLLLNQAHRPGGFNPPHLLTTRKNLRSAKDVRRKWIDCVPQRGFLEKLILDLTSSVSETYDRRERWLISGDAKHRSLHRPAAQSHQQPKPHASRVLWMRPRIAPSFVQRSLC